MAIFTAVRNKKQTAGTMMGVLKYVTQACKTMLDDQWMVTGHNCVARASYLEMMTTKQQFRKTDGRQFYHFVQSFPAEDGLTPQQVNAIGVEFAQKQFPDFEVVVATHLDTNHLHNHLVVNSVSCKDGKSCTRTPQISSGIGRSMMRSAWRTGCRCWSRQKAHSEKADAPRRVPGGTAGR